MNGQGSPANRWLRPLVATRMVGTSQWILLLLACSLCSAELVRAAETQARLRFAWGGGARTAWETTVSIEQGSFSDLVSLGIEADEPGSMWIDKIGQVQVQQRSGRTYDAFDVTVTAADPNAKLSITLKNRADDSKTISLSHTLQEILQGLAGSPLDENGNRLLIKRAPGDVLRVETERDNLVYATGEDLQVTVKPQLLQLPAGTNIRLHAELINTATGEAAWAQDYDVRTAAADEEPLRIEIEKTLPSAEGVYDLTLSVTERSLRQRLVPSVLARPIAERKLQLVVLSSAVEIGPSGKDWQLVSELDPANPGWWQRSLSLPQLKRIPGWPQGPLRHGKVQPWKHALGTFTKLEVTANTPGGSWEAFPLAVDQTGMPHLLEIEFPADTPQNLGVSILEPNAAGAILPIGIDSGVYLEENDVLTEKKMLKHRVIFWPRTKTPLVLLTQLDTNQPAGFGKLKLYSRPSLLTQNSKLPPRGTQRLIAGYMDRPLLPENFSAPEVMDVTLGQTVDDWQTHLQSGRRLIDYIHHVGQNALMLSVLADGSTIYPSKLLAPTPRYDTGQIGTQGRDHVRKDVLEMLFRMFDREGLSLIPSLHFDSPLPALEQKLRNGGRESVGITWMAADGSTWLDHHSPVRELAPYYNPLNEHVQQAMLEVFHEMAARYANHPSFAGIGISLTGEGYTQLLGPEWGMDENTIAQFENDMQTRLVTQPGQNQMQQRARYLLGEGRSLWLQWRAQRLARLYRMMEQDLQSLRPGAKLYLAPTDVLNSKIARSYLRPSLPQHTKVEEALLEMGLAPTLFEQQPNIVFLRPQRSQPTTNLGASAIDLQLRESVAFHQKLSKPSGGGLLFYHPPQRTRLESFDRQSPYGAANTYTLLISQPLPAGEANRQRFITGLATADAVTMFDGGWLLPLGQEDEVRRIWNTYQQLPPLPFKTSTQSRQPVTIRTHSGTTDSHIYLVNDSPWPVKLRLRLNAGPGCEIFDLGKFDLNHDLQRDAQGAYWDVSLTGYDLAAARFTQRGVDVTRAEMNLEPEIEAQLDQKIHELGARAAALESQLPLDHLQNPGFELPVKDAVIPGWQMAQKEGSTLQVMPENPHLGKSSARWASTRQVASLQSNLFETPGSGRLAVAVWLRIEDPRQQPMLRLAVEDNKDGQTYYRFAQLGQGSVPLKSEWTQYIFPVEDLPLEGLPQMRVRFDLLGPGVVWLDDVQLYHLKFSQNERIELSKILVSARGALKNGDLADCLHMLEGYWPQFLTRYVPDSSVDAARAARATAGGTRKESTAANPAKPMPEPGTFDKLKEYVPKFMRF